LTQSSLASEWAKHLSEEADPWFEQGRRPFRQSSWRAAAAKAFHALSERAGGVTTRIAALSLVLNVLRLALRSWYPTARDLVPVIEGGLEGQRSQRCLQVQRGPIDVAETAVAPGGTSIDCPVRSLARSPSTHISASLSITVRTSSTKRSCVGNLLKVQI
jgi:hypothetical protein